MDTSTISANSSSDSESDISFEDPVYAEIDITDTSGRAIALWSSHHYLDTVMFAPTEECTVLNILRYAETKMGYNKLHDRVMLLGPGMKEPIDLLDAYFIKPGSVVMLWPAESFLITIEINQLKTEFPMNVDPISTVYQIKSRIKKIKGIPIERQEILYRDRPLLNNHWLFEYRVQANATLHILLQLYYDLQINIKTFWGKVYRLCLDPCMTGNDLINKVFNRTFHHNEPEHASVLQLYIPSHTLVLQYNNRLIKTDYCLAYFGIKSGETLNLTILSHSQLIDIRTLSVVLETGECYKLNISTFDRWSVVAFMLHGVTGVPMDFIRLFKKGEKLDFSSVIGEHGVRETIVMNVCMTYEDKDIMYGIPLRINLGNTLMENVMMAPDRKIRDVKVQLEEQAVPNASMYELVHNKQKLPDNVQLREMLSEHCGSLSLRLEHFPVFVHGPGGVIYRTHLAVDQTFQAFKQKMELKSGHAMSSCSIIMAGEEYTEPESMIMYENGASIDTSIFLQTYHEEKHFFVIGGNWLKKVKFSGKLTSQGLKRTLWDKKALPESVMTSLYTFLSWFFEPRLNGKNQINFKSMIGQRLPAARKQLLTHGNIEQALTIGMNLQALNLEDKFAKKRQNKSLATDRSLVQMYGENKKLNRKKHLHKNHEASNAAPRHNRQAHLIHRNENTLTGNHFNHLTEMKTNITQRHGTKLVQIIRPNTRRKYRPVWLGYLQRKNLVHRLSTVNQVHASKRNREVRNKRTFVELPVFTGTPSRINKPMSTNTYGNMSLPKAFVL